MARMTLEQFTESLRAAWGGNLLSVVLFGSVATGDEARAFSDTNLLVTARRLDAGQLRAAVPSVGKWIRAGNPPPVLMTRQEILRSADVFPIEYADILDARRVLEGPDPFKSLRLSRKNLRVELEREYRGNLMRLRARILAAGNDPQRVGRLMLESVSTFLVLLRAALRLFGKKPPLKKMDSLAMLRKHMVFDEQVFRLLYEARRSGKKAEESTRLLDRYLTALEETARSIDR
jgi:predicted nucleotidyltransferase